MRGILLNICRILAVFGVLNAAAFGFVEGEDYIKLKTPIANMDKTLIKVFSYACPMCYETDKAIALDIAKELEGIVDFKPFHIKTQGVYAKEASEIFAVLLINDKDNGISSVFDKNSQFNKAKMAYYKAYHDKKERWKIGGKSFIKAGLNASGLSEDAFEILKKDQRVKDILDMWNMSYDIAKTYGAPTYMVNGKYLINSKYANSTDILISIVKELADK
ncbi:MAG: thiol:disulfide interchange protein [Campylobacteraceae bacterium]|jgi:thiol:disulfide interchange protein DsbA|nr:thiol:disulfide interchange protein [Campylobacteraceae bacterium]